MAFCVRNGDGDFIFAQSRILTEVFVVESETKATIRGLNYYLQNYLVPLVNRQILE